jgi:hypothetical protein
MTIENSDDTVRSSAIDSADVAVAEEPSSVRASAAAEDVDLSALSAEPVLEPSEAVPAHDSIAPTSRKLAPPPKPRRDSGHASRPPSGRPPSDAGLDSALASSALKAPIAPTISYSADDAQRDAAATTESASVEGASDVPALPPVPGSGSAPPLSAPPPIPRRRSNPSFAAAESDEAPATPRSPSDSVLARAPSDPAVAPASEPLAPLNLGAEIAAGRDRASAGGLAASARSQPAAAATRIGAAAACTATAPAQRTARGVSASGLRAAFIVGDFCDAHHRGG